MNSLNRQSVNCIKTHKHVSISEDKVRAFYAIKLDINRKGEYTKGCEIYMWAPVCSKTQIIDLQFLHQFYMDVHIM